MFTCASVRECHPSSEPVEGLFDPEIGLLKPHNAGVVVVIRVPSHE
jgi:hypothetical protein